MVTSGGFSSQTYRSGFDLSVPIFSPLQTKIKGVGNVHHTRSWLAISSQLNIHDEFRQSLMDLSSEHPSFLLLGRCASAEPTDVQRRCRDDVVFSYPDVLKVKY